MARIAIPILVGLFLLQISAPTAYAADLGSLTSVSHGGVEIIEGQLVTRSQLTDTERRWVLRFEWPRKVKGSGTFWGFFRGTFGDVDGGSAVRDINYSSGYQNLLPGTNIKVRGTSIPALGELETTSSFYTVLVAETDGASHQEIADWFASGGTEGVEPKDYASLELEYDGAFNPQELDAINEIWHGGRAIADGETVLKKEITTDSNLWQWTFSWPNRVDNTRALFAIFRGTFGDLEGGTPQVKVNYGRTLRVFTAGANTIRKAIDMPTLANASTTDHVYTVAIMERDAKYLDEGLEEQIQWFASGGASGIPPLKYSTLEFNFREFAECCSNVAFIPGIKATELWEGGSKRWLPRAFLNDAEKLAMTSVGESVNDVNVGEPIQEAYGVLEIYGKFSDFLYTLKNNSISNWKALPYDWRHDVFDVANNPQKLKGGSTLDMLEEVRSLAASSDTGRVTIIAHSNGGLVGKALISALGADAEKIVDKFIMVGTPQLGTPFAIGAMLHGHDQAIGFPFFCFKQSNCERNLRKYARSVRVVAACKLLQHSLGPCSRV